MPEIAQISLGWWVLLLLAVALLGLLAWWAHVSFWQRRLGVSMDYALEERIATPDGSAIELRRLPPHESAGAGLPPIVVVHGLGANHRNNDLHPDHSLARLLASRGRDVWLVTLRSGLSRRSRAETRLVRFAHMVRHDLPIAIDNVLERTGAGQVDYVGFSMGGMLLYAAIGESVAEGRLRRVVIIGSPALIRLPVPVRLPRWIARLPAWLMPTFRLRLLARSGAFASEWVRTPAHRLVFNPANVAPGIARSSLMNVIEDVPGPLNLDFAAWAVSPGGAVTLDGHSVLERLAAVRVPALFFAGSADLLAPPVAVRAAYEAWGKDQPGVRKHFVELGTEHGAQADYGHGDLAVGAHARQELFEPIAAFLDDERVAPAA